jgi:hypothetical protein
MMINTNKMSITLDAIQRNGDNEVMITDNNEDLTQLWMVIVLSFQQRPDHYHELKHITNTPGAYFSKL